MTYMRQETALGYTEAKYESGSMHEQTRSLAFQTKNDIIRLYQLSSVLSHDSGALPVRLS